MPRQYTRRNNLTKTRRAEYNAWFNMVDRCYNPGRSGFESYGGRGIGVCERWRSYENGFENFLSDMGPRPHPNYSIDRINNDEDYAPLNCAWRPAIAQMNNRRRTIMITVSGRSVPLAVACRDFDINPAKVWGKVHHRGLSFTEAFLVCLSPEERRKPRRIYKRRDAKPSSTGMDGIVA